MSYSVRPARRSDAALLPDIERSAGEPFRDIPDLAWIADDEVGEPEFHESLAAGGTVWVAVDRQDRPIGFLSAEIVGDALHIWELAVAHEAQNQGLGRRLMEVAEAEARRRGLASETLTTFSDVAWNAPFYQRLGFEMLSPGADVRLDELNRLEAERGLPRRCAMRKRL
ncbi:MAG: GNAT family N-acetyltransferase [Caulobacteraceae bacterium]|nr:GNAT family N-acetyltransferase [Caulobacteraceae bacterium]